MHFLYTCGSRDNVGTIDFGRKREELSFLSATNFALSLSLSVGLSLVNTGHLQNGCRRGKRCGDGYSLVCRRGGTVFSFRLAGGRLHGIVRFRFIVEPIVEFDQFWFVRCSLHCVHQPCFFHVRWKLLHRWPQQHCTG